MGLTKRCQYVFTFLNVTLAQCGNATNIGPFVDPTECQIIAPGQKCSPLCVEGYTPVSALSFTCPANGGSVDLSSFACQPTPPGMCHIYI